MKLHIEEYLIDDKLIEFYGRSDSTMDVKFNRVARIAKNYINIVKELNENLRENKPCSSEYNLAACTYIILKTGVRVGNEDSAEGFYSDYKEKGKTVFAKTYGITTMLREHVSFSNGIATINFVGKKHVENTFVLDPKLSMIMFNVMQCNTEPLFNLDEYEVTHYVKKLISKHISTKDLRTFRANVYAYEYLNKIAPPTPPETKKEARSYINKTVEYVAKKLNNTPGVVKASYVDPKLFERFFPILTDQPDR